MSKSIVQGYSPDVEAAMLHHYKSLSEPQKRQYAYIEAKKLGWGGLLYISLLLSISYKTIRKGGVEIKNNDFASGVGRQRKVGGGRKKKHLLTCSMT